MYAAVVGLRFPPKPIPISSQAYVLHACLLTHYFQKNKTQRYAVNNIRIFSLSFQIRFVVVRCAARTAFGAARCAVHSSFFSFKRHVYPGYLAADHSAPLRGRGGRAEAAAPDCRHLADEWQRITAFKKVQSCNLCGEYVWHC